MKAEDKLTLIIVGLGDVEDFLVDIAGFIHENPFVGYQIHQGKAQKAIKVLENIKDLAKK